MNPAVTMAFLRLGKVRLPDAFGYVLAQFVGGTAGIVAATALLRGLPSDPSVNYVATLPGPAGQATAFIAEAVISFLMMSMVLVVSNRTRLAHLGVGSCIAACAKGLGSSGTTRQAPLAPVSYSARRCL